MNYFSTNNPSHKVSFQEAVRKGLPDDNGLFLPESIPVLPDSFISELPNLSLQEIGFEVAKLFVGDEIPEADLKTLVYDVLSFKTPIIKVEEDVYSLELYHGPTLAFKDVGARFMARCLSYFNEIENEPSSSDGKQVTVLAATSGDTGSAVANGFLGVEGVQVVLLYPKGKVSPFQEKQMTTLGKNIKALEIEGSFDDCQKLVKTAFLDQELSKQLGLTSANSINIARLIPQSFYYFYAYGQLVKQTNKPIVFSVPSGNYGNLTAGVVAQRMGLPIHHFVAATNANDIIPHYLQTGNFTPKPSVQTISNAMDVGNPSNFARLNYLFGESLNEFTKVITGNSYTDDETKKALQELQELDYTADPHGAVGYLGLKDYQKKNGVTGIFLETAHPIKFKEVVEPTLGIELDIPDSLRVFLDKEKVSIPCSSNYQSFKQTLKNLQ
ncbi:MAG: threonine synthase [Cyclobacteriaceae bacterium]|nr:threonine synthase [Cyclobacteriaceae bacterium]